LIENLKFAKSQKYFIRENPRHSVTESSSADTEFPSQRRDCGSSPQWRICENPCHLRHLRSKSSIRTVSDFRLAENKPPGHWAKPKCAQSKPKSFINSTP